MSGKPAVDVVIVNWNAGHRLRDCLASIPGALDGSFALECVVVVDNASADGSLEGLERLGLPLLVIANEENRGFGAACNQGARAGRAEHVLFLNPDTRLGPDSLAVPLAHLAGHAGEGVGAVGIRLLDERGRASISAARFPSAATFLWVATGLDRVLPRARLGYRMSEWDHATTRDVDHVMGAFYLVRRAAFESVGGFDERFFVYFEDLDLSRRLARAGLRLRHLAEASARHEGGGTTQAVPARRLAYFLRGKLRYARKHHGPLVFALAAAATLLVEPCARVAGALLAGRPRAAADAALGYLYLLVAEPEPRRAPAVQGGSHA